ncbi:cell shape-determining protein MreC [Vibrio vulnificus]
MIVLSLLEIRLVANLTLNAVSFGSSLHSFWHWTCVCLMLLRKMTFKQMCLKNHC